MNECDMDEGMNELNSAGYIRDLRRCPRVIIKTATNMALSRKAKKNLTLSCLCALYLGLGTIIFVAIESNDIAEAYAARQEMERQRLRNDTMISFNMSRDEYDTLYAESKSK